MKLLLILFTVFYVCRARLLTDEEISKAWQKFRMSYGRQLGSLEDQTFRKSLFGKGLQEIEDHNERFAKGLETFRKGINKFVVFTDEELKRYTNGLRSLPLLPRASRLDSRMLSRMSIPNAVNWTAVGVVTPVKNQGLCGSCWAFATIGALEAHLGIYKKINVTLSEQQLVDCSTRNYGCNGGWLDESYHYIWKNGGINYNTDYPYEARNGRCRYDKNKPKVTISSYKYYGTNFFGIHISETDLKYIVATRGPVTAGIHVPNDFFYYYDGIFYNERCTKYSSMHAVVIVGYGSENGQDYWLVKNSWGSDWGLGGYIKMARNRRNHCGIASDISYPLL